MVNVHFQEPFSSGRQSAILSAVQKELTKDHNIDQIIVGDFSLPLKKTEGLCPLDLYFCTLAVFILYSYSFSSL